MRFFHKEQVKTELGTITARKYRQKFYVNWCSLTNMELICLQTFKKRLCS